MNKLNNDEQEIIDRLVNSIDHYRRAINEFKGMEIFTKDALRKLMNKRNINVVYTSDNRRISLDDRAVMVERRPR